jgi:transcriptional regulator with XRE-family HTH domain
VGRELDSSSSAIAHMPSPHLPNYLRSNRKRLALSQEEVAFLLGTGGGARVCRDERFVREPSLQAALAYEAIFQRPARELFAGIYDKVKGEVAIRARALQIRISCQKPDPHSARKLEALARIVAGASDITPQS